VAAGLQAELPRSKHMRWNFTVFGADIAFFSLGLSISSVYTVLPLFVHHLTLNNVIVGMIPAIRSLGIYGPQLLVAREIERRNRALPYILTWTVLERVPFLLLGIATILLSHGNATVLLALFMGMIFLATLGSGICYPGWLDLIARAIPSNWMGRFFGFWNGLGGFMGIGGAAIAAAVIARVEWPFNFALCFLMTFGAYVISYVLLALGREPHRQVDVPAARAESDIPAQIRIQMHEIAGVLRGDRGLLRLILSNALAGGATMGSALFAVAALRSGGLSDAQVGLENTVLFVAMTLGNIIWGLIGDRYGHRAVLIWGATCIAAAAAIATIAHGLIPYTLVFLALGLNLAATGLAGLTFIAEFGPPARRPTYIALASVAYAPFVIGAPILGGIIANAWGFTPVFVLAGVAGTAAALAYGLLVPDPRKLAC